MKTVCSTVWLALLLAPAAAGAEPVVEHDVVDVSAPKGVVVKRVSIDNRLGDITVEGHDQDNITVRVVKRAGDRETLERLMVSLMPDSRGSATISTSLRAGSESRPVAAGSIGVDLVVQVPRTARVSAESWNGAITVSKVDQGAELIANEGEITVRQVSGPVSTESLRGRQVFAEIFGDLAAQAVEGDLDFDLVRGRNLRARAVRGDIVGRRVHVDNLSVFAVHGSVVLDAELVAGGRYSVSSRKGSVELRLAKGGPEVALVARTAHRPRLPPEWRMHRDQNGRWVGESGQGAQPANLQLRSDTKKITIKRF
jgi:hypothetical protein